MLHPARPVGPALFLSSLVVRASAVPYEQLVTGLSFPVDIALDLDGGHLYWAEDRGIWRNALNGNAIVSLVPDSSDVAAIALDVPGGWIYWTSQDRRIQRARLEGLHGVEEVANSEGQNDTFALALDSASGYLYWYRRGFENSEFFYRPAEITEEIIYRAKLSGEHFASSVLVRIEADDLFTFDERGRGKSSLKVSDDRLVSWMTGYAVSTYSLGWRGTPYEDAVCYVCSVPLPYPPYEYVPPSKHCAAFAIASVDHDFIYYIRQTTAVGNYSSVLERRPLAACRDTSVEAEVLITDLPRTAIDAVALNARGGYLYWLDYLSGSIERAVVGCSEGFIGKFPHCVDLVADPEFEVYVAFVVATITCMLGLACLACSTHGVALVMVGAWDYASDVLLCIDIAKADWRFFVVVASVSVPAIFAAALSLYLGDVRYLPYLLVTSLQVAARAPWCRCSVVRLATAMRVNHVAVLAFEELPQLVVGVPLFLFEPAWLPLLALAFTISGICKNVCLLWSDWPSEVQRCDGRVHSDVAAAIVGTASNLNLES